MAKNTGKAIRAPFALNKVEKPVREGTPALAIFFNGAPYVDPDKVGEGENVPERHRGNTPWYLAIPAFGISFMLRYGDGSPVMGWLDPGETVEQVQQMLDELLEPDDIDRFLELQEWDEMVQSGAMSRNETILVPSHLSEYLIHS